MAWRSRPALRLEFRTSQLEFRTKVVLVSSRYMYIVQRHRTATKNCHKVSSGDLISDWVDADANVDCLCPSHLYIVVSQPYIVYTYL